MTITDNIATMFERSAERLWGPAEGDRRTDRVTWAIDRFKRAFELIDEIGKLIGSSDGRSLGHTALGYVPRIAARLKVPSERRDQLSRVVQDCKRALNSINELGSDAHMLQRLMLKKTVEECEGAIAEVDEVEPSSGDQASRARRTLTVELAVELILKFGDRMPTVILVNEVADMLYELVTEKVPSNMDEYASKLFKKMEAGGFPDDKARRRLDRDGEIAACEELRENLTKYGLLWPPD